MQVGAHSIKVYVNGAAHSLTEGARVADLIGALGLEGKRIAVERNGEIVPRSRYAHTTLANADRLEIVGAVGGG